MVVFYGNIVVNHLGGDVSPLEDTPWCGDGSRENGLTLTFAILRCNQQVVNVLHGKIGVASRRSITFVVL